MQTLPESHSRSAVLSSEISLRPAKASLKPVRKAETYRILIGAAVKRARLRCEWNLKDASRELWKDERQIARWESGEDRTPVELLLAHDTLRQPFLIALCEMGDDDVTIETVIHVRRRTEKRA